MTTVTLSKKITKGEELVVVPKRAYIQMERAYRRLYGARTQEERWRAMEAEADADIRAGRVSKEYRTVASLKRALNRLKR